MTDKIEQARLLVAELKERAASNSDEIARVVDRKKLDAARRAARAVEKRANRTPEERAVEAVKRKQREAARIAKLSPSERETLKKKATRNKAKSRKRLAPRKPKLMNPKHSKDLTQVEASELDMLNMAAICILFGVANSRAITRLIQMGMPVVQYGEKGKQWRFKKDDVVAWHKVNVEGISPDADTPTISNGGLDSKLAGTATYEQARTRKMNAEAEIKEIQLAKERGDAVSINDVKKEWEKLIGSLRSKLLGIPVKVAPQVEGCEDMQEVESIITGYIRDALDEISSDD